MNKSTLAYINGCNPSNIFVDRKNGLSAKQNSTSMYLQEAFCLDVISLYCSWFVISKIHIKYWYIWNKGQPIALKFWKQNWNSMDPWALLSSTHQKGLRTKSTRFYTWWPRLLIFNSNWDLSAPSTVDRFQVWNMKRRPCIAFRKRVNMALPVYFKWGTVLFGQV